MSRALRLAWRLMATCALYVWIVSLTGCASIPDRYRACVIYGDKRFHTGTVIEKRQDGAKLFRFDDPTAGDNGYRWISDEDPVDVKPCAAASAVGLGSADSMSAPAAEP